MGGMTGSQSISLSFCFFGKKLINPFLSKIKKTCQTIGAIVFRFHLAVIQVSLSLGLCALKIYTCTGVAAAAAAADVNHVTS